MSITDHRSASGIRIVAGGAVREPQRDQDLADQFDPLVRYVVDRHRDRTTSPNALLAAGRRGLRAVLSSNTLPSHSREFLAQAVRGILDAVRHEIARQALARPMASPENIRRAAGEWEYIHGRSPAVSELADLLRLSPTRILGELDYH